jgi:outer membrane protein assembly factor BamB
MHRRRNLTLLCLLVLTGSCDLLGPGDKPPNRVLWEVSVDSAGWSGQPADDGVQVFVEADSGIIALNPLTGARNWYANLHVARGPAAWNIVYRDGAVYMIDRYTIFALSASNGTVRWQVTPVARPDGAYIAVDDRSLYLGTRDEVIVALDIATGAEQWSTPFLTELPNGGVVVGFAVSGDTLYAAGAEYLPAGEYQKRRIVRAYQTATGTLIGEYKSTDSSSSAGRQPNVVGDLLLLSDLVGGSFFAVDRFTMREIWRVVGDPYSFGPNQEPVVSGDTVFAGSADTYVYAANLQTGALYWRTFTGGSIDHFALCGNFVLANLFTVAVINRRTHKLESYQIDPDGSSSRFATSGFAVVGDVAVVEGTRSIYGLSCR